MKKVFKYILILITVFAIFSSFVNTSFVYAATDQLEVTDADLNTDDDDVSYVARTYGSSGYNYYTLDDFSQSYKSINSVTVYVKVRNALGTAPYIAPAIQSSGINEYGTTNRPGSSYTTYNYTWTTDPATGSAWTQSGINNAKIGWYGQRYPNQDGTIRVTYLYAVVDYEEITAPSVTTDDASSILYDGDHKATLNGEVTDDGGDTIDYYGFVWDTSDKGDGGNVDPSTPPGTWSNGWKSGAGDYGENTFSHQITGLSKGTEYYFRAAAHNSEGWVYGDAVSFVSLDDPSGDTTAATNVASTSARINANVTDDGGQDCDVRFAWEATASGHSLFGDYDNITDWVIDTYATGSYPYVDISSLAVSTEYHYMVQIRNDVSTINGTTTRTFTTESGVFAPTNLIAVPTSTTISTSWTKGVGANSTLVRYSTGSYPTGTSEGTLAYFNTGNSDQITGLSAGTTYYISAWGYTGGVYSGSYTTILTTTLAYDVGISSDITLDTPPESSTWLQTPNESTAQGIPLFGGLVAANADAYGQPEAMMWYFGWMMFSVAIGIIIFVKANNNLPLALFAESCIIGLGAVIGLTMLFTIAILCLIGAGFTMFAHRY